MLVAKIDSDYLKRKSTTLSLLKKRGSVIAEAIGIRFSREAIYKLQRFAVPLQTGIIPKRKSSFGAPKKTSSKTDKLSKHEVTSYPSIAAVELKNKYPEPTFQLG